LASTIIRSVTIITGDPAGTVLHDAAVAIDGARIAAVGPSDEIVQRYPAASIVDGRGKALAPGLANCHNHLSRVLARGVFEDQNAPNQPPYSRKGFLSFPKMTPEERDVMVQLSVAEAIRSGTTLIIEVASGISDYADLLAKSGLRFVLAEQVADRAAGARVGEPGRIVFDSSRQNEGLARIEALHRERHGSADGRLTVAAAAHAPDMVSPELFKRLQLLQDRLGIVATVHLNQYWGEVEAIKETFGRSPTEHLNDLGYLHDRVVAVHCRCMTPVEESILARRGVTVCFTPAATARCGNSPRVGDLAQAGCPIVLGTDEFAQDMVEVMRLSLLLERVRRGDSQRPTPSETWAWASCNGYKSIGMDDAGSIAAGNRADLIMVNTRKAHLIPTIRIASAFIHQGQASDVEAVMVDGHWIMKDGRILTLDEDALLEKAERLGRIAWRRSLANSLGVHPPADLDIHP